MFARPLAVFSSMHKRSLGAKVAPMITVSLDELLTDTVSSSAQATAELTLRSNGASEVQERPSLCCLLRIHPLDLDDCRVDLQSGETVFGREDSADITLEDRSVSRKHAVIERLSSLYVINDLGSTNGTYVNGKRVDSQPLQCGDRVRLGDQIFKFLEVDGVEAQYHALMHDNVSRDGLTGAFNKRYFTDALERRVTASARNQCPVGLILIDIDFFKLVNDTHGHLAGDDVLKELVRRLTETLSAEEVVARYGGEEFAILVHDPQSAAAVAERCRTITDSTPFETTAGKLNISMSAGVAVRRGELTPSDLVAAADAKLYEAKRGGRNQVCVDCG